MAKFVFTPKKNVILAAVLLVLMRTVEPAPDLGAIVTNGVECAAIVRKIFDIGGSVADAAISALLCEGVGSPQSTGLGGGFVMTIKKDNILKTLIARDVAALKATEDMFVNRTVTGILASSVPGELKGYWELHQEYGLLNWTQLFDPVIELCRKGHIVSSYLANILRNNKKVIQDSETLSEIYINPDTGDVYQEGDLIKRNKLADTMEIIQKEGADALYSRNGTIAKLMVQDYEDANGIVTIEDFLQYEVRWEDPISTIVKDRKTVYTIPLPGGGPLVAFVLNVLNEYLPSKESVLALHRIAEAFKFAFAKRNELGDDQFVESVIQVVQNMTSKDVAMKIRNQIDDSRTFNDYEHYGVNFSPEEDHGTSHINIIAPNGDAIAATSTINTLFGCKIVSRRTGIIWNDGMSDFSTPGKENYGLPPNPSNFIRPRKMALSSMSPTIMLDENRNVELILGAAGGTKIITSVIYVMLRYLYFNETIATAVDAPRIHHKLAPMRLNYESGFAENLIEGLREKGHNMYLTPSDSGFAALTAIAREGDQLTPRYDLRRGGSIEVIESP